MNMNEIFASSVAVCISKKLLTVLVLALHLVFMRLYNGLINKIDPGCSIQINLFLLYSLILMLNLNLSSLFVDVV